MRGYSQVVMEANALAPAGPGVALGSICIVTKYPVKDVANRLNVSRQTVYDWFTGKSMPMKEKTAVIEALINELSVEV